MKKKVNYKSMYRIVTQISSWRWKWEDHSLVWKKCSFEIKDFKYFGSYKNHNGDKTTFLIRLSKWTRYISFEKTKFMAFMLEENYKNILQKYSKRCSKVGNLIGKEFSSETVYNTIINISKPIIRFYKGVKLRHIFRPTTKSLHA